MCSEAKKWRLGPRRGELGRLVNASPYASVSIQSEVAETDDEVVITKQRMHVPVKYEIPGTR